MEMAMRMTEECYTSDIDVSQQENEEAEGLLEELCEYEDYTDNERLLFNYHQTGDREILEKLARYNMNLIYSLAQKYRNSGIEFDDLVGVGNLQLVKCIHNYNIEKKQKFSSYLYRSVEQQMISYIQDNTTNLSLSIRDMRRINTKAQNAKYGIQDTESNITEIESITTISLDSEQVSEQAFIEEGLNQYETNEIRVLILKRIRDTLTSNQFQMLVESEGLLDGEPLSFAEIARRHGKTEGAVRGARNEAIYKLHKDTKLKEYLYLVIGGR